MKVSIIIPVKEINDYIREAISYILKLNYKNFEIIILPDKISKEKFEKTRIISTGNIGPSEKRDIGVKNSKGDIIAFLDDDTYPKKDWLDNALKNFNEEIVAVGGPGITPESDSLLQKASGYILSSKIGGGGLTYRYIAGKKKFVDDFPSCNFLIKKSLFNKIGGFNSKYWPGEDTKLCLEIIKQNKKIIYDPNVVVYHHRRKLFTPHLKQIFNYSKHRGYFAKKYPQTSFKLGYFIPSLFVLGLIFGFVLSFFNIYLKTIYLVVISLYGILVLLSSLKTKNTLMWILIFLGIFLTHITYGIGFIIGLLKLKLEH